MPAEALQSVQPRADRIDVPGGNQQGQAPIQEDAPHVGAVEVAQRHVPPQAPKRTRYTTGLIRRPAWINHANAMIVEVVFRIVGL